MNKKFYRILATVLSVVLVLSSAPLGGIIGEDLTGLSSLFATKASAYSGTCGAGVTWDLSGQTLTIRGSGAMDDYSNAVYYGTPLTTAPWKEYASSIREINVIGGVTRVGDCAFYGLTSVTTMFMQPCVTEVGDYAFYGCSGLGSLSLQNAVTIIGEHAFENCSSVNYLHLSEGLTDLGAYAFAGCTALDSIQIPATLYTIPEGAFSGCENLSSVYAASGANVRRIGASAFAGCVKLATLSILNSIRFIGANAFNGCTKITGLSLPDCVTSVGAGAFEGTGFYNSISNWSNNVLYSNRVLIKAKPYSNSLVPGLTGEY